MYLYNDSSQHHIAEFTASGFDDTSFVMSYVDDEYDETGRDADQCSDYEHEDHGVSVGEKVGTDGQTVSLVD